MVLFSENANWEQRLYDLAHDTSCNMAEVMHPQQSRTAVDRDLHQAIAACEAVTARYSRSFYLASALLPAKKRRAIRVLYAFCRTADNLADENVEQPAARLRELRQGIYGQPNGRHETVLAAWAGIQSHYQIPLCYAEQLLDGVERDLKQMRYQTFEDLSVYCYGVASTVGLMSMRITGFVNKEAVPYAIKLGVALQLTNILRDVGEDWRSGRLYLPLNELSTFGLGEHDVAAGKVDERWRRFMRFQISRARRLYADAMPGIGILHPDSRFAVAAAAMLYQGILDDIQANDFDVFNRRAVVRRRRKLALLLGAFGYVKRIKAKQRKTRNITKRKDDYGGLV